MNKHVLLELAKRWEHDAKAPEKADLSSEEGKLINAVSRGRRESKRECADTLRTLIDMLGE